MSTERVNPTWSKDEDNIVREAVYKTKREGGTMKSAFVLASNDINRTIGAITFRWNNKLKYSLLNERPDPLNLPDVINYIENLKAHDDAYSKLEANYDNLLADYNNMLNKFSNISKIIS